MALTILTIGLLVFAGHFLTGFFERTKIPDVLILMLAGIVIGPMFPPYLVSPEDFGKVGPVFTTIALIIILFEAGIHLNVRELRAAAGGTLVISLATFAITVLLAYYAADLLLPVEPLTALLIGTILGGASPVVIAPLVRALTISIRTRTVLLLDSAITDVLAVVLSLGLIRAMTVGMMSPGSLAEIVATSFLVAALIGSLGGFVWSAFLPLIRQFPNTIFTTIAYVMILYGLTEWLGYSGAIAALTFGITVANLPNIPDRTLGKVISFRLVGFAGVERAFFAELVFLVKTFFFVFLGISISLQDWHTVTVGLTVALLAVLGRLLIVRLLAPRAVTRREAFHMTVLIPKGLAAAVLAAMAAQRGLAEGTMVESTVYAAIFFSITLCAIAIFAIESGWLDTFAAVIFKRHPTEPDVSEPGARPQWFEQSLGLPSLPSDMEEPNPVQFTDDG